MKSKSNFNRDQIGTAGQNRDLHRKSKQAFSLALPDWFSLIFGAFLGLTILKFGNPVILETKIETPKSVFELWSYAWPPSWTHWGLVPLILGGGWLAIRSRNR